MSTLACPRCREEVSLPNGASPQALVECPFCLDRYALSEALQSIPPALKVIDDPAAGLLPVGVGESAFSAAGERGERFSVKTAAASAPAFDFREAPAPSATSAPRRPGPVPVARPRRKPKNAFVELVKVIGGGVVAFPLAILLLWWVFRVDRFELGPKAARIPVLKHVVPKEFRGDDLVVGDETDAAATAPQIQKPPSATPKKKVTPKRAPSQSKPAAAGTESTSPPSPSSETGDQPPDAQTPDVDESASQDVNEVRGVLEAPTFSADEFDEALLVFNQAREELAALSDQDAEKRSAAEGRAFRTLAALAHVTTFLAPEHFAQRDRQAKLEKALRDAAATPEQRKLLARSAADWLAGPLSRTSSGIVAIGVAKSIVKEGPLFVTRIDPAPAQTDMPVAAIEIFSYRDPRERFQEGDRVIALGSIVQDPAHRLAGYRGTASELIWGGFPVSF